MRSAWISSVIKVQKFAMMSPAKEIITSLNKSPVPVQTTDEATGHSETESSDNSLLVVRYEKKIPTPEQMSLSQSFTEEFDSDNDSEKLVIDDMPNETELTFEQVNKTYMCPYCSVRIKSGQAMTNHILVKHYNTKPFKCAYCDYNSYKRLIQKHQDLVHANLPRCIRRVSIPKRPPDTILRPNFNTITVLCLYCEQFVQKKDIKSHMICCHDGFDAQFVDSGTDVYKCSVCSTLRKDLQSLRDHQENDHNGQIFNYTLVKLLNQPREVIVCSNCNSDMKFRFFVDLERHHKASHPTLQIKYEKKFLYYSNKTIADVPEELESDTSQIAQLSGAVKRKLLDVDNPVLVKRVAKKSTTKLPSQIRCTARKSTTKLPSSIVDTELNESVSEFSFYGTKPTPLDELANVTTHMPFFGTMMPFTLKKLSTYINISPQVVIEKLDSFN